MNEESLSRNEAVGFVAYSVEDAAAAINSYASKTGSVPISASIVQEGEGTSATIKALAVFAPLPPAIDGTVESEVPDQQSGESGVGQW